MGSESAGTGVDAAGRALRDRGRGVRTWIACGMLVIAGLSAACPDKTSARDQRGESPATATPRAAAAPTSTTSQGITGDLAAYVGSLGVEYPALKGFVIERGRSTVAAGAKVTKLSAKNGDVVVRLEMIEKLGAELAELYLSDRSVAVESVFNPAPAHYPGVITRHSVCPEEFKPVVGSAGPVNYYLMYASDRFSFGVCTRDRVSYRMLYGLAYCAESDLFFDIRWFYTPDNFDKDRALEKLASLGCQ